MRPATATPPGYRRSLPALLLISLFVAACGRKEPAAAPPSAALSDSVVVSEGNRCVENGLWKPCVLLDRLTHAGVGPKEVETDTTRVPFLSSPGLHYTVGKNGLLMAFYYADSAKALKEWRALDTLRLVPAADTVMPWPAQPMAIRAGNLIVAFFGTTAAQIERVGLAIRAGLPVPVQEGQSR